MQDGRWKMEGEMIWQDERRDTRHRRKYVRGTAETLAGHWRQGDTLTLILAVCIDSAGTFQRVWQGIMSVEELLVKVALQKCRRREQNQGLKGTCGKVRREGRTKQAGEESMKRWMDSRNCKWRDSGRRWNRANELE